MGRNSGKWLKQLSAEERWDEVSVKGYRYWDTMDYIINIPTVVCVCVCVSVCVFYIYVCI